MTDSVPLLGDISLEFVQRIEHSLHGGFVSTPIAGLPGEVQQRLARHSHRLLIAGLLIGEEVASQLETLQQAAESGEALTFAADIASALELQSVVITSFKAVEVAGQPNQFHYEVTIVEDPPLPPPAEISGFGGLDDFGLGDLGFDTDILGDLEDLAGDIAGAVDDALDVLEQLGALANLDGLDLSAGFLQPMDEAVNAVGNVAAGFQETTQSLTDLFGS
jgi:hypothetical protein